MIDYYWKIRSFNLSILLNGSESSIFQYYWNIENYWTIQSFNIIENAFNMNQKTHCLFQWYSILTVYNSAQFEEANNPTDNQTVRRSKQSNRQPNSKINTERTNKQILKDTRKISLAVHSCRQELHWIMCLFGRLGAQ